MYMYSIYMYSIYMYIAKKMKFKIFWSGNSERWENSCLGWNYKINVCIFAHVFIYDIHCKFSRLEAANALPPM